MSAFHEMHAIKPNSDRISTTRPIPFNARHAIEAFLFSGLMYGLFLAWALLLSRAGVADHVNLAVAHLGGAMSLITCWKLGRWGHARFDSFGAALLLMGVAFRLHGFVDALAYGTRIDELYRYRTLPLPDPVIDLLLKGELITVLGMLLVACSWRLVIGNRIEKFSFLGNGHKVPIKLSLFVYAAAILVDVARRVLGIGFGPLEQLLTLLYGFGVAAIYLVAARKGSTMRQVTVACLLAIPMSILALSGGMKEDMLFPFIPAAILYWMGFNNIVARSAAVVLGIALLALSQMYVHYVRETTWRSTGNLDVSTGELVAGFGGRVGNAQSNDALGSISSRINQTSAHATTVTLADHRGHEPMAVFGMIPASVVPRVLWPGKPVMQPGAMHTARILGGNIPVSQIRSATAAGFFTELYLGGWWLGVILGAITYGALLAGVQKWASRHDPGFGHQALCFLVLYWTIRFDENHVVYAYTSLVFTMIFIWMLKHASRALGLRTLVAPQDRVLARGASHE